MKPAALLAFLTDINAIGLEAAQGLYLTDGWYWTSTTSRANSASALLAKANREPTMPEAAYYSATLTYLNAVKAAGTTDADKVMAELHKAKIDDVSPPTAPSARRADGA